MATKELCGRAVGKGGVGSVTPLGDRHSLDATIPLSIVKVWQNPQFWDLGYGEALLLRPLGQ